MPRSASGQWKPPQELLALRERLEEVFDAGGAGEAADAVAAQAALRWMPAVDVLANDRAIAITLEVGGLGPDDLQVELSGRSLTVRGERQRATSGATYHRVERAMGPFERVIGLPGTVDPERVEARLDRGVLSVRLLRASATVEGSRRIRVDGSKKPEVR